MVVGFRRDGVVRVCGVVGCGDAVGVLECEGVRRGGEEEGDEDVGEGEVSFGSMYTRN